MDAGVQRGETLDKFGGGGYNEHGKALQQTVGPGLVRWAEARGTVTVRSGEFLPLIRIVTDEKTVTCPSGGFFVGKDMGCNEGKALDNLGGGGYNEHRKGAATSG